ncbi:YciI family protein [Nocardia takedensis]
MKNYLLALHQPVGDPPPPEVLGPIMDDLRAVEEEMKAAGVWVFSGGLHGPEASTVVRMREGEVLTTDGPYAEGKEHLGGIVVIAVADLDEALAWAAKQAAAVRVLPIEVRPFQGEARN